VLFPRSLLRCSSPQKPPPPHRSWHLQLPRLPLRNEQRPAFLSNSPSSSAFAPSFVRSAFPPAAFALAACIRRFVRWSYALPHPNKSRPRPIRSFRGHWIFRVAPSGRTPTSHSCSSPRKCPREKTRTRTKGP
jgi:hypothetical protein